MPAQGLQQVQKQAQTMVLAPQLRQSLKLLQVSALELRSAILEELQTNPVLEELPYDDISLEAAEASPAGPDAQPDAPGDEPEAEPQIEVPRDAEETLDFSDAFAVLDRMGEEWHGYLNEEAGEIPYTSEDARRRQHFFDSLTAPPSFQAELLEQARLVEEDPEVLEALEFVLGSLDDAGLLTASPSDLALMSGKPLATVQKAVALLRGLDPPGLGAQSVQECLLLQLQRKGLGQSLAARIVQKHWPLLLRRRIPELARALRVPMREVEAAIEVIAGLDPAPARRFAEETNHVIEPDVTVEKDANGQWQIILNNDFIPRLRINPDYKQLLAKGRLTGKDREYLQGLFRSGRFLISAIEQLHQTIERITRALLKFQADFFERGPAGLRPLTMSQVAESVGVHETTVSRAIANKYIRTPHGVFEMKYFFTPGYQGEDGREVSNTSIKDRIARIIAGESPRKPLSDQKIVEMLKGEGITIARRTVAKYRDELGIPPTNLRRQYA